MLQSGKVQGDAPERRGFGELPRPQGNIRLSADGPAVALAEEARRILGTARARGTVSGADAAAFARACIEQDAIGRLALGVMDGGVFVAARLVELALAVAKRAETGEPAAVPKSSGRQRPKDEVIESSPDSGDRIQRGTGRMKGKRDGN